MGIKSSDFSYGKYKSHHIVTTDKLGQRISLDLTDEENNKFKLISELLGMNECELLLLIYERGVIKKWGMVEKRVRSYEIRG